MILKVDPGGTFFKTSPSRKNTPKGVYGTDSEPIDTRGPKVTGKVKGGNHDRT